jgi:hypothetical protein
LKSSGEHFKIRREKGIPTKPELVLQNTGSKEIDQSDKKDKE